VLHLVAVGVGDLRAQQGVVRTPERVALVVAELLALFGRADEVGEEYSNGAARCASRDDPPPLLRGGRL